MKKHKIFCVTPQYSQPNLSNLPKEENDYLCMDWYRYNNKQDLIKDMVDKIQNCDSIVMFDSKDYTSRIAYLLGKFFNKKILAYKIEVDFV